MSLNVELYLVMTHVWTHIRSSHLRSATQQYDSCGVSARTGKAKNSEQPSEEFPPLVVSGAIVVQSYEGPDTLARYRKHF